MNLVNFILHQPTQGMLAAQQTRKDGPVSCSDNFRTSGTGHTRCLSEDDKPAGHVLSTEENTVNDKSVESRTKGRLSKCSGMLLTGGSFP